MSGVEPVDSRRMFTPSVRELDEPWGGHAAASSSSWTQDGADGKILHNDWAKYLAEFVGTYFLVLTFGCNVLVSSVGAALSIGSMLTVMTFSLGSVSGAHLNPAITVTVFLSGRGLMPLRRSFFYICAQLMGACLAGVSSMSICGGSFALEPVGRNSAFSAGIVESIYTAALCYVVLNVTTTEKQDGNQYFGLAIGFTVVAATLAIGGISGCSLNPAVAVGLAFASTFTRGLLGSMVYLPLYVFAPFAGSIVAFGLFYSVRKVDEYSSRAARVRR